MARPRATLSASGFSTSTCLPARSASSASPWCVRAGVAMATAWMSGSSSTRCEAVGDVDVRTGDLPRPVEVEVADHPEVPLRRAAEVADQVGTPVAGTDHGDAQVGAHRASSSRPSTLYVDLARDRAGPAVTGVGDERYAAAPDPPDPAGGRPDDEGVVRHVPGHDGPGPHARPASDRHRRHADCARTDGGSLADGHADRLPVLGTLAAAVGCHRPGIDVVGEHHGRPDEDAVLEDRRLVDQRLVLHLAALPEPGTGADVDTAPQDRLGPDLGAGADHGLVPHLRAGTDAGTVLDGGGGSDDGVRSPSGPSGWTGWS